MKFTPKIQKAIKFSIKTHEVYQKQKRKGKDIAYITHPLTVGLILATAGASEDVIIAGILHDTIEDSIVAKKVSEDLLAERFGAEVATMVASVSEMNKGLSWKQRKQEAVVHIAQLSNEALMVKSANLLANINEMFDEYARDGDKVFQNFNAPVPKKMNILSNHCEVITSLLKRWKDNPLREDLLFARRELRKLRK
ncbi:HD domain-containing protein [Candidatus Parcubacteria bacterium]|nr:HD domain-containing protein [Patescibacteria group bacterium]MBU4309215.1 HD domain-containing protein [Patescibacteria group bacterium]MBU4432132.1 HD domain-containing protein [Patescibacteria group bacterium]MBU4577576.1 HD domain-containing protein [Patescibacteria group bacterium]MCG2697263.1 HD domain-containing protein [Candidatus Parcubacteria bacterium]